MKVRDAYDYIDQLEAIMPLLGGDNLIKFGAVREVEARIAEQVVNQLRKVLGESSEAMRGSIMTLSIITNLFGRMAGESEDEKAMKLFTLLEMLLRTLLETPEAESLRRKEETPA